jgi:hypothetical protein
MELGWIPDFLKKKAFILRQLKCILIFFFVIWWVNGRERDVELQLRG